MAYAPDPDMMQPDLEIWLDESAKPATLRCAGTLDGRTRRAVLDAVAEILATGPRRIVIDVTDLQVGTAEGAGTLVQVQRLVRQAGAAMVWRGVHPARPAR